MKKTYQAPAVEVMGLDGDRHVMMELATRSE